MKTKELIATLKAYDPESAVVLHIDYVMVHIDSVTPYTLPDGSKWVAISPGEAIR